LLMKKPAFFFFFPPDAFWQNKTKVSFPFTTPLCSRFQAAV
jgi:hypothetical protein